MLRVTLLLHLNSYLTLTTLLQSCKGGGGDAGLSVKIWHRVTLTLVVTLLDRSPFSHLVYLVECPCCSSSTKASSVTNQCPNHLSVLRCDCTPCSVRSCSTSDEQVGR
ncbi:hypothetical protein LZ31DRAFT_243919 [Colletotrichum somersetense]|nr:hypothetical protein LZ31DRAFT_243919 [Colletotrichum somersetense]